MYFARFDTGTAQFVSALLSLRGTGASRAQADWVAALLNSKECDFALRFQIAAGAGRCWLWLVASDEGAITRLLESIPASGATLEAVGDSAAFDAAAGRFPPVHLRLNHAAYHAHEWPLSSGFHLLPMLDQLAEPCLKRGGDLVYQMNCHRCARDSERERRLRKLDVEIAANRTLPIAVRRMQQTILSQALQPGYLVDEFIAVPDEASRDETLRAAQGYFEDTCGHLRFPGVPLDAESCDDCLVTGAHSTHFGENLHPLHDAGGFMSTADLKRLLLTAPTFGHVPSNVSAATPKVFISYSGRDFTSALAVCHALERQGNPCWIAPRNIMPGESYPEAIIRGIKGTRVLVLVFSEASNVSPHVQREVERALHNRATIIPLRLEARRPEGSMEYLLSLCQWVDGFPGEENFANALNRVCSQAAAVLAAH